MTTTTWPKDEWEAYMDALWATTSVRHRHDDRTHPTQNLGAAHIRGRVTRRGNRYTVAVINTATGEVLNSDGPFCCLPEAVTEAAWRVQALRETWSMGLARRRAVRTR